MTYKLSSKLCTVLLISIPIPRDAQTSVRISQALVSSVMQVRRVSNVSVKRLTIVSPTQLVQNAEAKSMGRPFAARISPTFSVLDAFT